MLDGHVSQALMLDGHVPQALSASQHRHERPAIASTAHGTLGGLHQDHQSSYMSNLLAQCIPRGISIR
jgi:hypothetical protein